jgi:hypothetical protein
VSVSTFFSCVVARLVASSAARFAVPSAASSCATLVSAELLALPSAAALSLALSRFALRSNSSCAVDSASCRTFSSSSSRLLILLLCWSAFVCADASFDCREEISSSRDDMVSVLELSCAFRSSLPEDSDMEADALRFAAASWLFCRCSDAISAFCSSYR